MVPVTQATEQRPAILVPLDGSHYGEAILATVARLALAFGGADGPAAGHDAG